LANRSLYTTNLKTAPLVAGGVYCKTTPEGLKQFATLICCSERHDGRIEGWLQAFGYPHERVMEGSESMAGWDLVSTPQALDNPIISDKREDEVTKLRRENARLKAELSYTEEGTGEGTIAYQIRELRDKGLKWSEVGEKLGMSWQKAKKELADWEKTQVSSAG
jgi:hypothetical protein